jgi:hypothetical protein
MKVARRASFGLSGALLVDGACRAQGSITVWSEWAYGPWERQGPEEASGLLLCLHEEGLEEQPVALIFAAMARIAGWDILRVNRRVSVDVEANDVDILDFISTRIERARSEGYRHVTVGGISRGGWLALLAATLSGVDAAIGLAPGTADASDAKDRMRVLADRLAAAKAKRIAVFFFAGDPRIDGTGADAVAVRRALLQTGSCFTIVDRPPDLHGRAAAGSGRFTRRYRDGLAQFIEDVTIEPGEVTCPQPNAYAVGAEIGFPSPDPSQQKFPANADPALAPFWGRWEGDNEAGAYVILQPVSAYLAIALRIGYSAGPASRIPWVSQEEELPFQIDGSRRRLYYRYAKGPSILMITLKSESELEFEDRRAAPPYRLINLPVRLRKQAVGLSRG